MSWTRCKFQSRPSPWKGSVTWPRFRSSSYFQWSWQLPSCGFSLMFWLSWKCSQTTAQNLLSKQGPTPDSTFSTTHRGSNFLSLVNSFIFWNDDFWNIVLFALHIIYLYSVGYFLQFLLECRHSVLLAIWVCLLPLCHPYLNPLVIILPLLAFLKHQFRLPTQSTEASS